MNMLMLLPNGDRVLVIDTPDYVVWAYANTDQGRLYAEQLLIDHVDMRVRH